MSYMSYICHVCHICHICRIYVISQFVRSRCLNDRLDLSNYSCSSDCGRKIDKTKNIEISVGHFFSCINFENPLYFQLYLKSIFTYQNGLGSKKLFSEMFLKLNFTEPEYQVQIFFLTEPYSTSFTLHLSLCILHSTSFSLHPSLYILHSTSFTLHPSLYILHSTSFTLHHSLYILHSTSFTLHPSLYILQININSCSRFFVI
jgi:hypothetical protein